MNPHSFLCLTWRTSLSHSPSACRQVAKDASEKTSNAEPQVHVSSILFGDTMVPNIE